jgi:hypothetical protein
MADKTSDQTGSVNNDSTKIPGSAPSPETEIDKRPNGGEPKPDGARKPGGRRRRVTAEGKAKGDEKPTEPLPNEPEKAPETPKGKRTKEDYPDGKDIFAEDGDDDDLSEEAPSAPKLVDKLPKAKYIRFRPGAENTTSIYTIQLDEEDQRPGEIKSYVLTKDMRDYFENHLDYKVTKVMVLNAVTLQGDFFLYMTAIVSEFSGNTWNISRREMIAAGMKGWIIVRSDMKERKYKFRIRKADKAEVKFEWPTEPIRDRVLRAINGPRLISSREHPIVRRLEGEADDGDQD